MTRALFVTNMYPPHHLGGYELICHDVASRLHQRGHDVAVLTSSMRVEGVDAPDDADFPVHRDLEMYLGDGVLLKPTIRERLALERANQAALRRAIDRHQPDVVSVWHMGAMSLGLLSTILEQPSPIVYSICDDWLSYADRLDTWTRLLRRFGGAGRVAGRMLGAPSGPPDLGPTGAFLWISKATRDRAVRYTGSAFPLGEVVWSGIDSSLYRLGDVVERPWAWRLMYSGRLDPRKGVATIIDALPLLPNATLDVVGASVGDERTALEAKATELRVDHRLTFAHVPRAELPARYGSADVVVFPSEWEEPFGLVPIEAMACNTPVVATGVGGSAEFLRDGSNCLLFPPGDAHALAKAVEQLATDAALRARLVEGGRRTAATLDVERLTDRFEAWHGAAVDGYRNGPPAISRLDLPASPLLPKLDRRHEPVRDFSLASLPGAGPSLAIDGEVVHAAVGSARFEVRADLAALPFRSSVFTAARCVDALDRLPSPDDGVDELARVLRLGAPCRFAAVNWHDVRAARRRRRDRKPRAERYACDGYPSPRHLHSFTVRQLRRLVGSRFTIAGRPGADWFGPSIEFEGVRR